jgi:hemolysin activation/secretion protein
MSLLGQITGALPAIAHAGLVLTALGGFSSAVAQVIPPSEQPGRERERFIERRPPAAQPGGPAISLPSTGAPDGAAETKLVIRRIQIVGSTVYRTEELAPLYQELLGREVPLQAIYDAAQRITAKYGADGYVLSRAVIPVQELEPSGATVKIEVVEGWIDKVEWPREKLARYRDFFSEYGAKIVAQRPANIKVIERYLLFANDLPGLKFTTALKASEKQKGASTLVVDVVEKPVDAAARFDNRGTAARGPYQFLTTASVNNLFGRHEQFSVAYAGVPKLRELQLIAPTYRQVLNSEGLTAFVNGTYSWGRPGTVALEDIEFETRSHLVEAGLAYPIIRSRERNLVVSALGFASESYSWVTLGEPRPQAIDRIRGIRIKADADFADSLGGINQFNLTFSQGIDGLGSTENGYRFASREAGRVDFTKLEGFASRLQPLFDRFSALIAAYGQYASTSLLSPEQCGFGGRTFGRAFDPSEQLGDRCWQISAELRYDLPVPVSMAPSMQLYGFTDRGVADTIAPGVGTPATQTGTSAGGGVRLGWQNHLNADLSAVKAIEGPRNDWRFFLVTTARY